MKSVLFVATEGLPFIKSGGLADVVGSLPKELNDRGYDTRVILPLYQKIADKYFDQLEKVCEYEVHSGDIHTVANIFQTSVGNTIYYFVQHQGYFERDGLYGFDDDDIRFAFFTRAVLEFFRNYDYFPNIVHFHDWHAGMIALLARVQYGEDERYRNQKYVYTIHNLAFQGNFDASILDRGYGLSMSYFYDGSLRFHQGISTMKAALLFADKITTVSDTYSKEILTQEFGEHMESILASRAWDLSGIVNGIDVDMWNPATDRLLERNYDDTSVFTDKVENKRALQKALGLRVDDNVLLLGLVSRLTWQKGIYLMIDKMMEMMGQDVQLVILGTGEAKAENELRQIEYHFPRRAVYYCGYNEELSHQIYAGCDLFMMPSLFEPCGISQLISMRYGTLPLVRETGGLKDTVIPYNQYTGEGTGFSFTHFSAEEMMNTLKYAIYVYYEKPEDWKKLQMNAMHTDVSWSASCEKYIELYESI